MPEKTPSTGVYPCSAHGISLLSHLKSLSSFFSYPSLSSTCSADRLVWGIFSKEAHLHSNVHKWLGKLCPPASALFHSFKIHVPDPPTSSHLYKLAIHVLVAKYPCPIGKRFKFHVFLPTYHETDTPPPFWSMSISQRGGRSPRQRDGKGNIYPVHQRFLPPPPPIMSTS